MWMTESLEYFPMTFSGGGRRQGVATLHLGGERGPAGSGDAALGRSAAGGRVVGCRWVSWGSDGYGWRFGMPLFQGQQGQGAGQIWEPQAADSRLAQTAGANEAGVFTSDLSVSEYVLLGEAGFEPLGFVIGSSIYHVGLQIGRWNKNQELTVLTQAMYNARELAMARMRAEADHLAADGIVGVQLRLQMYSWGQNCLEF